MGEEDEPSFLDFPSALALFFLSSRTHFISRSLPFATCPFALSRPSPSICALSIAIVHVRSFAFRCEILAWRVSRISSRSVRAHERSRPRKTNAEGLAVTKMLRSKMTFAQNQRNFET